MSDKQAFEEFPDLANAMASCAVGWNPLAWMKMTEEVNVALTRLTAELEREREAYSMAMVDLKENEAELQRCKDAMESMRKDLLMRADVDDSGVKVVACGATVWRKFNAALEGEG